MMAALRNRWHGSLTLRFGLIGMLVIAGIAAGANAFFANYITSAMLDREARFTRDLVLNVLRSDGSTAFFAEPDSVEAQQQFAASIVHFMGIPDLHRMNAYSRSRLALWSTDPQVTGRTFPSNPELDHALQGRLVVESGRLGGLSKAEHAGLVFPGEYFIETYIPVTSRDGGEVVGVIELYKAPADLSEAIRKGHYRTAAGAAGAALLLFVSLFWIVVQASRRIVEQQDRIVKAERLSVVAEMAASIAHNMRNPLSSLRTTAELWARMGRQPDATTMTDMMESVDRMESGLRKLMGLSSIERSARSVIDVAVLLREQFEEHSALMKKRGVAQEIDIPMPMVQVVANRVLIEQALQTIIVNAIEASPPGGAVVGSIRESAEHIEIRIEDSGPGISPEHMKRLFTLFFTTKPFGMGIGLALARRAIEQFGGLIEVTSGGGGTVFAIRLPRA